MSVEVVIHFIFNAGKIMKPETFETESKIF